MPHRLLLIGNLLEIVFLNLFNFFLLITFTSFFAGISIFFSLIYSIGKIKRDIDKYYEGSPILYIKYIIGVAKKN